MVVNVTASYFLLTADYGPEPNALDPIKKAILSAQSSLKEFIFVPRKEHQESSPISSNSHSLYSIRYSNEAAMSFVSTE
ncbi:hypothetical protein CRYUN_Cryun34aG0045100 [Craigia yunnanensis]